MVFWRKKSIVITEIIIVAAVLSAVTMVSFPQMDEHTMSQIVCLEYNDGLNHNDCMIFVDAVYEPENNIVKITYSDNSKMTSLVVLEILGMEETFHKEFSQQSFVEIVQFDSAPKYGWATMPVTFFLEHEELGFIGLKTEIHPYDESKPKVIYSKISYSDWSKLLSLKPES
uniref:Uncharacterized protein n=1 Tax=uncultured marine thaumarchaeote KM3_73_E02 TaxID=1456267 RepID=A0A075HLY2_9ARCH|nr:hypothetical protein [uncultured marine thaumarchaeote KM3_73_E02]